MNSTLEKTGETRKVFVSHASEDSAFVAKLVDRIEKGYEVFSYRERLKPGDTWESKVEKALKSADVFLVVVSEHSNASDWVKKETLFAEQEGMPRIPLYLSGVMPLRVIDLQYVDFRGDFDGGLDDLLHSMAIHASPVDQEGIAVDKLLGRAVRARIARNMAAANNLINQALSVEPDMARSVQDFWFKLREPETRPMCEDYASRIGLVENTEVLKENRYKDRAKTYRWKVRIDAEHEVLSKLEYVRYILHPTFKAREQVVRARESNFEIARIGWGQFPLGIETVFVDGSLLKVWYRLRFDVEHTTKFVELIGNIT